MSTVEERDYTYICPCGKPVGTRTDTSADPRIILSKKMHTYDFGFDVSESRVDFSCLCGRDYDGSGKWVPRDELPTIEPPVFMGNLRPEIPPHFNSSLGCEVESRAHLEHLQAKHGCEDRGLYKTDSDGVPSCVPRDLDTIAKRANEESEAMADQHFEAPGGEGSAFEQVKEDVLEEMGDRADEREAERIAEQTLASAGLSSEGHVP